MPTGDPTFLNSNFQSQPVFEFLNNRNKKCHVECCHLKSHRDLILWAPDGLGMIIKNKYMVERSLFPIYGNLMVNYTE